MSVYAKRRERVMDAAKGAEVAVMTPANLFWLTDFWGGGLGYVQRDRTVVVTGALEKDRAAQLGKETEVVVVKKWKEALPALQKMIRKGKAVVDDDALVKDVPGFRADPQMFLEARRVKDGEEVKRIAKASAGLDRIFAALEGEIRPGRTEWEVAAEVMREATRAGMTPSSSDSALSPTIIASGENGALPHSELTSRRIKRGDFVVADIFFRWEGYHSDATRTFAVGTATKEMKAHYSAVKEAQEAALEVANQGVACEDVNEAAVKVLKSHGMAKLLNHSVGHGVGIDIHELPAIAKGNDKKLVANDVITDEPGVYLPGKFGIRIEDTLVVGRKSRLLTRFTKDMITCG